MVWLVNESEFRNNAGVEIMQKLHNFKYDGQNDKVIKILTNMQFQSNNIYIRLFNLYLEKIRKKGVRAIFINLDM